MAVWTTSAALPLIVVGGVAGGSSGGTPYPPPPRPPAPPPPPPPTETPNTALTPLRASLRGFQNPRGPRSSSRYRSSLPSANHPSGRHSTPPPTLHWAASSCVARSVDRPSATPASA